MNIFGLGLPELIVIALILLLFFGKDRLPGLFRSIGNSIKEFQNGITGKTEQNNTPPVTDTSAPPSATPETPSTPHNNDGKDRS